MEVGQNSFSVNGDGEPLRSVYVEHGPHASDVDCQSANDGMCRQEFANECDINVLMARYEKDGVVNHFARGEPKYMDVSNVPPYDVAIQQVRDAEEAFMKLNARVRSRFDNDPGQFMDFCADPKNLEQLREWGLAPPAPKQDMTIAELAEALKPVSPEEQPKGK